MYWTDRKRDTPVQSREIVNPLYPTRWKAVWSKLLSLNSQGGKQLHAPPALFKAILLQPRIRCCNDPCRSSLHRRCALRFTRNPPSDNFVTNRCE